MESPAPFARFSLPDAWEDAFWTSPDAKAVLDLEPKAIADLAPEQAGLKNCRCPVCGAGERANALAWSPTKPAVLTCKTCKAELPNDKIPAKIEGKIPEETIEVLPGVLHRYPYHVMDSEKQHYPDERVFLAAKRDFEVRAYLSKFALYAAVRYHEKLPTVRDEKLARIAAIIILKFAQVYPAYAMHFDQPDRPKLLEKANLAGPYRADYQTAKWDSVGSLEVPMNLVVAYALLRDDSAIETAGELLKDAHPRQTIEQGFFRAAAELARSQTDGFTEDSLLVDRGLLAVARLLNDQALLDEAISRLKAFIRQGFHHDGLWKGKDASAQARISNQLDGWIRRLLAGDVDAGSSDLTSAFDLAQTAGSSLLTDPKVVEIERASWPDAKVAPPTRRPLLLGGAGLARLAVGEETGAVDVELKGFGGPNEVRSNRLSLRMSAAGKPLLDDLDDAPISDGWSLSSAAHNTVLVDGLNQRETFNLMRKGAAGANILFFACTPDFQVAMFEDPNAYPRSTKLYRQTIVLAASGMSRYVISVFEVQGGLQHDQIYHAAGSEGASWITSASLERRSRSLLPGTVSYLPASSAQDERWFVQAMGAFRDLKATTMDKPTALTFTRADGSGLRVHLLESEAMQLITGRTPSVNSSSSTRASLVLRRRSADGASLNTTFVTILEPISKGITPLKRVGRFLPVEGAVVLQVETEQGTEDVVVNLKPGTEIAASLPGGTNLRTDGLVARFSQKRLQLAGGTFAEARGFRVDLPKEMGRIHSVKREQGVNSRGYFEAEPAVSAPERLAGQTLLVRHGDGTSRGWTTTKAINQPRGGVRLFVKEEPGFEIVLPKSEDVRYYQFPSDHHPGPNTYRFCLIGESTKPTSPSLDARGAQPNAPTARNRRSRP